MQRLVGEKSLVRGDEHVGEGQQQVEFVVLQYLAGVVLEKQALLLLVNIQRHAAEMPGFEVPDERRGVDQLAATGVHDVGAGLHARDAVGVEQMVRLGRERQVQGHDVAAREKVVKRHVVHPALRRPGRVGKGIVGDDPDVVAAKNPRDDAADFPRADDARGLAAQIEAHEPLE